MKTDRAIFIQYDCQMYFPELAIMCRGELYLEQEIPGDPEKNHPDLVVINRSLEKAIIVDVTIPFEGENNQGDQVQYTESLVADVIKEVEVTAFIIGALDSWYPDNEWVLRMLGIGRIYTWLFQCLCCILAIEGSRKIWQAFCIDDCCKLIRILL